MIQITPKIRQIKSQLGEPEEWVSNLANKSLASQMTTRFEQYHCKDHPDFINRLEVDFYKDNLSVVVLESCCEKFKEKLDLLNENKDPFTGNEGLAF